MTLSYNQTSFENYSEVALNRYCCEAIKEKTAERPNC